MKIFVKAKPNAKKESVVETDSNHFKVAVNASPQGGKANSAVTKALAEHFDVPASRIHLVSGFTSRNKIFEIDDAPLLTLK